MLNGYRKPYEWPQTEKNVRAVPSTRFLSIITKDNVTSLLSASAAMLSMSMINIIILNITALETVLLFLAWSYFLYTWASYISGYRMEGATYNTYIWPIEKAFNEMSRDNRKKYSKLLDKAYDLCRLGNLEGEELGKIKELFELSKDAQHNFLDEELDLRRTMKKMDDLVEEELKDI